MKTNTLLILLVGLLSWTETAFAVVEPDFLKSLPVSHYRNQPDKYAYNLVVHKTDYYTHENQPNYVGLTEARHQLISVNSKLGIDIFNTIELSTTNSDSLEYFKLRLLDQNGQEVRRFGIKDLTVRNLGYEKLYKIALDELKIGYYIEYLYARQTDGYYFRPVLASAVPRDESIVTLSYPKSQTYKYKIYNSKATVEEADSNGYTYIKITDKLVEPFVAEDDAPEFGTKPYVFIAINSLQRASLDNLCNWTNIVNRSFAWMFKPNDQATNNFIKLVNKTFKLSNLKKEEQISFMDNYVRKAIRLESSNDISDPIAFRQMMVAGSIGKLLAYKAICEYFNAMAIDYQIILTCSRHERKFDYDFPHVSYVDEMALYFPEYKKYLSIGESDGEFGRIPEQMQGQEALRLTAIFDGMAAAVQIKRTTIPVLNYLTDSDSMSIDLNVTNDSVVAQYKLVAPPRSMQKKNWDYLVSQYKVGRPELVISSFLDTYHGDVVKFEQRPFITKVPELVTAEENSVYDLELKSADLVQRINGRLLIRYGQLIGVQSLALKKATRKLPAEVASGRSFFRTIRLAIPAGYRVVNPEQLIDNHVCIDGKIKFVTAARVEGQTLIIENTEIYDKASLTASEYQCTQDVQNAAVRFTKQFVVLEPVQ